MIPKLGFVIALSLASFQSLAADASHPGNDFSTSKCAEVLVNIPYLSEKPVPGAHIRDSAGRFGARRNTKAGHHTGVDITFPVVENKASISIPVVAVGDGVVIYSRYNGTGDENGYGYSIVVKHSPACYSFYAHLAKPAARLNETSNALQVGDKVAKGAAIGELYINNEVECRGPTGNIKKVYTESNVHLHFELIESPTHDIPANKSNNSLSLFDLFQKTGARWINPESLLLNAGYSIKPDTMSKRMPCHTDKEAEVIRIINEGLEKRFNQDIEANWPRVNLAAVNRYEANEAKAALARTIGANTIKAQLLSVKSVFDAEAANQTTSDAFKQLRKGVAANIYADATTCAADPACVERRNALLTAVKSMTGGVEPTEALSLNQSSVVGVLGSLASNGLTELSDDVWKSELYSRLATVSVSDAVTETEALKATTAVLLLSQNVASAEVDKATKMYGSVKTISDAIQDVKTASISNMVGFSETVSTFDGVLDAASKLGLKVPPEVKKVSELAKTAQLGVQAFQMFSAASNPMAAVALAGSLGGGGLGGDSGPDPAIMAALAQISAKLDEMDAKLDTIIETQKQILEKLEFLDQRLVILQNSVTAGFDQLQTSVTSLNYLVRDGLNSRRASCDGISDTVSQNYTAALTPGSIDALIPSTRKRLSDAITDGGFNIEHVRTCFNDGFVTQLMSRCSVAESQLLRENIDLNDRYHTTIKLSLMLANKCSGASCNIDTGPTKKDPHLSPMMAVLLDSAAAVTDTYSGFIAKQRAFEHIIPDDAENIGRSDLVSRCTGNTLPSIRDSAFSNFLRSGAIKVNVRQTLALIDDFLSVAPNVTGAQRGMSEAERIHEDLRLTQSALHLLRVALGQQALADGDFALEYVSRLIARSEGNESNEVNYVSEQWTAFYEMDLGKNAVFLQNLGRHLVYRTGANSTDYLGASIPVIEPSDNHRNMRTLLKLKASNAQWPLNRNETNYTIFLKLPPQKQPGEFIEIPLPTHLPDGNEQRTYLQSPALMSMLSRYVALLRYQVVLERDLRE